MQLFDACTVMYMYMYLYMYVQYIIIAYSFCSCARNLIHVPVHVYNVIQSHEPAVHWSLCVCVCMYSTCIYHIHVHVHVYVSQCPRIYIVHTCIWHTCNYPMKLCLRQCIHVLVWRCPNLSNYDDMYAWKPTQYQRECMYNV